MKTKIKGKAAVLAALMLTLNSCQLAIPEAAEETPARLVGAFITTESLQLFDMEAYLEDHIGSLEDGDVISEADTLIYGGRIYGQLVEDTFTDAEGNVHISHNYDFPDLEGLLFASFFIHASESSEAASYWTTAADEGLSDVARHFGTVENGEEIRLQASIYLPKESGEVCFYFNPVYQREDGTVYLTEGEGLMTNTLLSGSMSHSMTESFVTVRDGEQKDIAAAIEITLSCVDVPDSVVLIQMNEENEVVARTAYTPETMPESIVPEPDAAYIMMEEHHHDGVTRKLYQHGDGYAEVFRRADNGLCVKAAAALLWE